MVDCGYRAYGSHTNIDWSRHFFQKHFFDTTKRCTLPETNFVATSRDLCEAWMLHNYQRRAWIESILGNPQEQEFAKDDSEIFLK